MKKIIYLLLFLFILFLISNQKSEELMIPKDSIRFRVIANSNQKKDQENKKIVVHALEKDIMMKLKDSNSLEESRKTLKSNINHFKTTIIKTLEENDIQKEYNIDYGNHYFPEKSYKGVIYEEGEYESLVVTLGDGLGENFWCVLFPPLCLLEAEEEDQSDTEYKSFIKEMINKYF